MYSANMGTAAVTVVTLVDFCNTCSDTSRDHTTLINL